MKTKIPFLIILFFALAFNSQSIAQELPMPSSKAEVHQRVGLTDFVVEYSRPSVKGREIFGGLVPFNKVWRAGANMATTIEFNSTVEFDGVSVEAGKYSIFITPGMDTWEIAINKVWNTSGTGDYDKANNVATIKANVEKASNKSESWTIGFDAIIEDDAILYFKWDDVLVKVPFTTSSRDLAEKNIQAKLSELDGVYGSYNNIARYYLSQGRNEEALKYAKKSVESSEKFWNVKVLSEAYAANGDYKSAIKTAEKSLEMSKEAEYQPYIDMNTENIAKWKSMK